MHGRGVSTLCGDRAVSEIRSAKDPALARERGWTRGSFGFKAHMNSADAALAIPESVVRTDGVIGLRWDGDELVVGLPESMQDDHGSMVLARLRTNTVSRLREVRVPDQELRELIDTVFGQSTPELPSLPDGQALARMVEDTEGPIAELVTTIIDRAVRLRASDIHIEPGEHELLVRVRVDGALEELTRQPMTVAGPIVSRLKVLAQMNIVERRLPQDGQFGMEVAGRTIDVRLATVATLYGEKAVMRLLDTRRPTVDIAALGMHGRALETFERMLRANYGMIIAAGPTGAGKTTTLQCALRDINTPLRNVSTLEDPVEYVVDGINHIPVNEAIGAGFATQLRAILRQDPDVVLIGEVRDIETAKIGVQAALSGRLVLTSLHAQDAVSVIYRLFQLDVEPHLVAASLRGVIAQRLLRRVCRFCGQSYAATPAEQLVLTGGSTGGDITLRRGAGCALCRGTGYRDRDWNQGLWKLDRESRQSRVWDQVHRQEERSGTRPTHSLEQVMREDSSKEYVPRVIQTVSGQLMRAISFDVEHLEYLPTDRETVERFINEASLNKLQQISDNDWAIILSGGTSGVETRASMDLEERFLQITVMNRRHRVLMGV